jgi:hypothetical protein
MMHRLRAAALLLVPLTPLLGADPPPLSPAWQASLDGYLGDVRRLGEAWKLPDVDGRVAGMQGFLTPVVRRIDASGRPVLERVTLRTADGATVRERSTATPDGRNALLEEAGFGLTPPMGMSLVAGSGPSDRVLSLYQAAMQDAPLNLAGTYRDLNGGAHRVLAPAVLQTMREYPDPQGDLRSLQPWHQFFREADTFYLPSLANTHGVELAPEALQGLDEARARHRQLEDRLVRERIFDPKAWTYDLGRLPAAEPTAPPASQDGAPLADPQPEAIQPAGEAAPAAPPQAVTPASGGFLQGIFGF